MPKFLEKKLKAEYPNNPRAVFGSMNAMGAMPNSLIAMLLLVLCILSSSIGLG